MDNKQAKKKVSRAEGFLGLHFDFHADMDCDHIGKTVTPETIVYIIDKVNPDYIQCDCSGVPGISSYPTKVGNPAPGFVKDQLRIWRDVTAEHNIPLLMHFCGLWSKKNVQNNPDWGFVDSQGKASGQINSYAGEFGDKLLVPQMKELIDEYGVDGVWVDGDSWVATQDFRPAVLAEYEEKTGKSKSDILNDEACFADFTQFCRSRYREYLSGYVNALHEYKPDFQVCTNWAYSSYMPEPVEVDVDFLSGDVVPLNGFNHSRFDSRYLVHQGKPWDIMAWSFAFKPGTHVDTKSALQMKQEAAITIAQGGAMTFYFPQTRRDGSVAQWHMDIMSQVAGFCREREEYCFQVEQVPQIAMLHSSTDYYRRNKKLFAPRDPFVIDADDICQPQIGILQCLLESQNVVDVVSEHHLATSMDKYGLVVVPEVEYMDENFRTQLLDYVSEGGNVLLIGTAAAKLFEKKLGISLPEIFKKSVWLENDRTMCTLNCSYKLKSPQGHEAAGRLYPDHDIYGDYFDAASVMNFGNGKLGCIYFDMGDNYSKFFTPTLRNFLGMIVDKLFTVPLVRVSGSQYIDVSLGAREDKLFINLINTSGPHSNKFIHVFDEIPTLRNIEVTVKVDSKPSKVVLQPENRELEYEFNAGQINFKIAELEIHSVIVIEKGPSI